MRKFGTEKLSELRETSCPFSLRSVLMNDKCLQGKPKNTLPYGSLTPALAEKWDIETPETVQKRATAFWDEIFPVDGSSVANPQDFNILVSSHGAWIEHLLEALHERGYTFPTGYGPHTRLGSCAIVTIEMDYVGGKWKGTVTELGSSAHLGEKVTLATADQVEVVPDTCTA